MKRCHLNRISELPDGILYYILSLMPTKWAVQSSILSKRWRNLWKYNWIYSSNLDFGKELMDGLSPKQFKHAVNCILQLHESKIIKRFQVLFYLDKRCLSDTTKWIEFAISKGVEELNLDLDQSLTHDGAWRICTRIEPLDLPDCLFNCKSLTHLSLSLCIFRPPSNFSGFQSIKTLHLRHVKITDSVLENMLSNCLLLEKLYLRDCGPLNSIKICAPDLKLKSLTLLRCWNANAIEIFAPSLNSFQHYGHLFDRYSFRNILSLEDAQISLTDFEGRGLEHGWRQLLLSLTNVKVLTMCTGPFMLGALIEHQVGDFRIEFRNLQELQIVMESPFDHFLSDVYIFFQICNCPCLKKLFIKLPFSTEGVCPTNAITMPMEELPHCVFHHLKIIKMNAFKGQQNEIQLVKFFLEKAVVLQSMILITPQEAYVQNGVERATKSCCGHTSMPLAHLHERLLPLQKSSPDAQIVLCEFSNDYSGLHPLHNGIYCWV